MVSERGTAAPGPLGSSHLGWIPAAAAIGFTTSFLLGDIATLPVDLYYAIYFGIVLAFLRLYARRTALEVRGLFSRRRLRAVVLGALGGVVLMQGVLLRPETAPLTGGALVWALAWRGVAYGAVDGLLLLAFPWIVSWRALGAEHRGWSTRIGAGAVALAGILLVTTSYHLGYGDFRSRKVVQPDIGAIIGSAPTLLSANPAASVLSHVVLHVTAVLHSPETELFLPPHRPPPAAGEDPVSVSP